MDGKPIRLAARGLAAVLLTFGLNACGAGDPPQSEASAPSVQSAQAAEVNRGELSTAIFAAGCFWCVEEAFDKVPGVVETTSGYTGGQAQDPSYRQVSAGGTGHTEGLKVLYDPAQVSYDKLLDVFWHNVDPTDAGGQFCDRGSQYRSGIFYVDEQQAELAQASKRSLQSDPDAPSPIVTEITAAGKFYPAEEYHQDYHRKNSVRYTLYKTACGRAARLEELWGPKA